MKILVFHKEECSIELPESIIARSPHQIEYINAAKANRGDTSPYDRAKTIAERAAWAWLASEGGRLELVAVNPGLVLGPVSGADYSASIEFVKKLLDGSIPALPRFGFNVVDMRDVARLHVLAMTTPEAAGQRFVGSGDFYWMS
jgi:dihydroflavonol-4-reductase